MFNEDQKLRYLKESKYELSTIKTITTYFNKSAKVEMQEGMDLSQFNRGQITDLLTSFNSRSRSSLQAACVYFSDYYNWCKDKNLVEENSYNEYDNSMVESLIDSIIPLEILDDKFFKYEQMLKYLKCIKDVSNKFLVYAIYCGILQEELVNLKIKDFNKEDKTISLNSGRIVKVDDLFINLMESTNKAEHYFADGDTNVDKIFYYEYADLDYVLKPMARKSDGNPISTNVIFKRLKIVKEQCNNKFLTIPNLYKNGLVNYILCRHREINPDINLKTILMQENEDRTKDNIKKYIYDEQTEQYIEDFGSTLSVAMLRLELAGFLDKLI